MHKISEQTAEAAQKHALQSLEQGKSIEEVGKRLQSDDLLEEEIGQSIEWSGKTGQTQLNSPENIHNVVPPYSTLYVEILFSIISKFLRIFARNP